MSRQNQWFAVRCCCTPKKVFGFIKLSIDVVHATLPEYRTLRDSLGHPHQIKLMSIYVNKYYKASCLDFMDFMNVTPSPPQMEIEHTTPEIAIYSDDRPIEFWRSIHGFVEAPQTED